MVESNIDREDREEGFPHRNLRSDKEEPSKRSYSTIPSSFQIILVLSFGILGATTRSFSGGHTGVLGMKHLERIASWLELTNGESNLHSISKSSSLTSLPW